MSRMDVEGAYPSERDRVLKTLGVGDWFNTRMALS